MPHVSYTAATKYPNNKAPSVLSKVVTIVSAISRPSMNWLEELEAGPLAFIYVICLHFCVQPVKMAPLFPITGSPMCMSE